ncbi:hypothetical protein ABER99_20345 [Paenibacillus glucanolyticus]|nr:hypothetical protein [Paenibacillus glucanolyticus]
MNKYIGQKLEIVYVDNTGKITQRRIGVKNIIGQFIYATCLNTGRPRTFRLDRVLAWQPANVA